MDNIYIQKAIQDFRRARRKADLQKIMAFFTRENDELLSYDDVRKKLHAIESSKRTLKEIPLDKIVGSVGRYTDFNREFLPLTDSAETRWARVMAKAQDLEGLPPIEVYQIGDVYFVQDGNHRVSVARQLGATHIEAYVTEVKTKVPVTEDLDLDDLIIKEELVDFLEKTNLDKLRPDADFTVTSPGRYRILLEHIDVHRYFMGIEQQREIPYEEAVTHWFDTVYLPLIHVIRKTGILHYFPGRTETDLYLWLSQHRAELSDEYGWQINPVKAAEDLKSRYSPLVRSSLDTSKMIETVPQISAKKDLDNGIPGEQALQFVKESALFEDILVTLSSEDYNWEALSQAVIIAQKEGRSFIHGLHVIHEKDDHEDDVHAEMHNRFIKLLEENNARGSIRIEHGSVVEMVCEHARLNDLVITHVAHPPDPESITRITSGLRSMITQCARPILAMTGQASQFKYPILAYDASHTAQEALYLSAYIAGKWGGKLTVITVAKDLNRANEIIEPARKYLDQSEVEANYRIEIGNRAEKIIPEVIAQGHYDSLIMGGYSNNPIIELLSSSLVNYMLNQTSVPILICH